MTLTGWYLPSLQRHITRVPTSRGRTPLPLLFLKDSFSAEAPVESTAGVWTESSPACSPLVVPLGVGIGSDPLSALVDVSIDPIPYFASFETNFPTKCSLYILCTWAARNIRNFEPKKIYVSNNLKWYALMSNGHVRVCICRFDSFLCIIDLIFYF